MDLKKFISVLQNETLFFCSSNNFEDNFEGSITLKMKELYEKQISHLNGEELGFHLDSFSKTNQSLKDYMYINCWYKSNFESVAMWKIYTQNEEGIAIKTTYKSLKESIIDKRRIFASEVNYIDYAKDSLPEGNALPHFLTKRKEFEYENEVRLISDGINENSPKTQNPCAGINLEINPNKLIEEIVISPYAQVWFKKLVEEIVRKYNLNPLVKISQINDDPIF